MKSSKVRLKLAEVSGEDHGKHNFKNEWTKNNFHFCCFRQNKYISLLLDFYLCNKSLDIITHSKCMHNKLSPTSDHCHSRAKEGVRAQLDRVRNSEVHI